MAHHEGLVAGLAAALVLSSSLAASAGEPAAHHLIYLHGRIVQERQSARPKSAEFGYYELDQIVETFKKRGFVVTNGIRPKAASLDESAARVVDQVHELLAAGVPASRIAVVGASMGSAIALRASLRLQNADVSFSLLGACMSMNVPELLAEYGQRPAGRILAIREKSDEMSEPCPPWTDDTRSRATLTVRELVTETGLRHGFLYRPLPEWVEPVVEWSTRR
jgi:pimeloyl-ACP methyl ester carboxylesterase